ncbi:MAG: DUF805 domain-containing protein [Rhodanobacteraceae bacterium]
MHWYLHVLRNYANFTGRARRSEYWYFVLVNLAFGLGLNLLDMLLRATLGTGPFVTLYGLVMLVPGIAVSIRRLHDIDRSGWWLLLGLVPFVGLLLIYFMALDSSGGTNRYGHNPKLAIA